VFEGLTVCVNVAAVAPLKLASPEYFATIASDGATSALVMHEAAWFAAFTGTFVQAADIATPPIVNDIVPVGATVKGLALDKVAVNVTD